MLAQIRKGFGSDLTSKDTDLRYDHAEMFSFTMLVIFFRHISRIYNEAAWHTLHHNTWSLQHT